MDDAEEIDRALTAAAADPSSRSGAVVILVAVLLAAVVFVPNAVRPSLTDDLAAYGAVRRSADGLLAHDLIIWPEPASSRVVVYRQRSDGVWTPANAVLESTSVASAWGFDRSYTAAHIEFLDLWSQAGPAAPQPCQEVPSCFDDLEVLRLVNRHRPNRFCGQLGLALVIFGTSSDRADSTAAVRAEVDCDG